MNWVAYAIRSAFFESLVAIFGEIGIKGVDSNLVVAIRTVIIVVFAWGIVLLQGNVKDLFTISKFSYSFIILSAIATGLSWLIYSYRRIPRSRAAGYSSNKSKATTLEDMCCTLYP